MCIEVIHNQNDLIHIGIQYVDKVLDFFRPIDSGSMLSYANMVLAAERFYKSENAASSMPDIF